VVPWLWVDQLLSADQSPWVDQWLWVAQSPSAGQLVRQWLSEREWKSAQAMEQLSARGRGVSLEWTPHPLQLR
jgi:hypothetical protein